MKLLLAIVLTLICTTSANNKQLTTYADEDCTGDWTDVLVFPGLSCDEDDGEGECGEKNRICENVDDVEEMLLEEETGRTVTVTYAVTTTCESDAVHPYPMTLTENYLEGSCVENFWDTS